jgi:putative ABC transport system substrate-binding protein
MPLVFAAAPICSTPVTLAVAGAAAADRKIVFSFGANPSDVGMDAKPSNMTGVSDQVNHTALVDLVAQLLPAARRLGMIYNPSERNSQYGVEQIGAAAKTKGMTLVLVPVSGSGAVPDATRSLKGRVDVIVVGSDNSVTAAMPGLVRVALESRTPVIAADSFAVRQGAVAAVSADFARVGAETGRMVIRLIDDPTLRPGSIDVLRVRGNALVLNTAAAKSLGLTLPPEMLEKAAQTFDKIAD